MPADAGVSEHPVVAISINGALIEVNGTPIDHNLASDPFRAATQAVARDFAQELDRPVRAFVTDALGARTLVIHPSGRVTDIEPYSLPGAPTASSTFSPSVPTALAESRRRAVLAAALPTALVVLGGMIAVELSVDSRTPAASTFNLPASSAPAAATPTPTPSRVPAASRSTAYVEPQPGATLRPLVVKGVSRGGIREMSLDLTSSGLTPVSVTVLLTRAEEPAWRRTLSLPPGGRTLSIGDLAPGVYTWSVLAEGATAPVKGTVVIRADEPSPAQVTPTPDASPQPSPEPGTPPEQSPEPEPEPSPTQTPPDSPYDGSPSAPSDPY